MKQKNLIIELIKLMGVTIAGWFLWVIIFSMVTTEKSDVMYEPFTGACTVFGFITAVIVLFIMEINSVNLLKQRVSQTLNNMTIANKRSDNLLNKANKVTEKYMSFETKIISDIASAIKPEKSSIKKIKNSSAFEQRINEFPELKSNNSIMELLKQLRESENIVANFKLEHNEYVTKYNYNINSFPVSIFKGLLKLKEFSFYSDDKDLISDEELGI